MELAVALVVAAVLVVDLLSPEPLVEPSRQLRETLDLTEPLELGQQVEPEALQLPFFLALELAVTEATQLRTLELTGPLVESSSLGNPWHPLPKRRQ